MRTVTFPVDVAEVPDGPIPRLSRRIASRLTPDQAGTFAGILGAMQEQNPNATRRDVLAHLLDRVAEAKLTETK